MKATFQRKILPARPDFLSPGTRPSFGGTFLEKGTTKDTHITNHSKISPGRGDLTPGERLREDGR
jgi:hypothetical protein